ncbi:hypothetical protein [Sediminitomix flava]|uniref:Lipoprotein n=1 Tax=Sediminitomix flava TaxID=379075 RepID=A0A315ZGE4_SEDFL|nr:hypothetical protein [Sediminitomix flava]PWJ44223.1 hypothetical protein BC781_101573 [Sediminitomix flava]
MKTLLKTYFSLLLISGNLLFSACQSSGSFIQVPLEAADVAFHNFRVDPSQSIHLELENGTNISIAPKSIVDKDGKVVIDSITIRYREIHDAYQSLLSGIPMQFKEQHMQTAGMFEIDALDEKQNKLYLKEGQTIAVDLASKVNDKVYPFFRLDTLKQEWLKLSNETLAEINPAKAELLDSVQSQNLYKETLHKEATQLKNKFDNRFAIMSLAAYDQLLNNIDYNLITNQKVEKIVKKVKEETITKTNSYGLKLFHYPFLVYQGPDSFAFVGSDLGGFASNVDQILWQINKGEINTKWFYNKNREWAGDRFYDVKEFGNKTILGIQMVHLKDLKYQMIRTYTDSSIAVTEVEAIGLLSDIYKMNPYNWKNDFDQYQARIQESLEKAKKYTNRASKQYKFIRKLNINAFGVYNCDYLISQDDLLYTSAKMDLKLKGITNEELESTSFWWMLPDERTNLKFRYEKGNFYNIPEKSILLTVLGDQVALCYPEYTKIRQQESVELELEWVKEKIQSAEDLKKVVQSYRQKHENLEFMSMTF